MKCERCNTEGHEASQCSPKEKRATFEGDILRVTRNAEQKSAVKRVLDMAFRSPFEGDDYRKLRELLDTWWRSMP